MLKQTATLQAAGAKLAALGILSFACTPARFPNLLAAAIQGLPLARN